uniref:Uncharacterized protein n=1 Tax=Triticum urartu TaxID=4572 RepID=A0A8R7TBP1_TRIUA
GLRASTTRRRKIGRVRRVYWSPHIFHTSQPHLLVFFSIQTHATATIYLETTLKLPSTLLVVGYVGEVSPAKKDMLAKFVQELLATWSLAGGRNGGASSLTASNHKASSPLMAVLRKKRRLASTSASEWMELRMASCSTTSSIRSRSISSSAPSIPSQG